MKFFPHTLAILILTAPALVGAQDVSTAQFQPITGIPLFDGTSGAAGFDLSTFFNRLYVLAVGAGAVIAVAQIMIAGFRMAFSAGSHNAMEEARRGIQNSVLGLLLLLSPAIVFGIINPDILSLKINTDALRPNTIEEPVIRPGSQLSGLSTNSSGAYDDVCDLKNAPLGPGFNIPNAEILLTTLGEGSESNGRNCCRLLDGVITDQKPDTCSLVPLLETDRWSAVINAIATLKNPGSEETVPNRDITIRTVGAHTERAVWDIDMIAIHGFRSRAACEQFTASVQSNPDVIAQRLQNNPLVGLIEIQNYTPDYLVSIDSITRVECRIADYYGYPDRYKSSEQ